MLVVGVGSTVVNGLLPNQTGPVNAPNHHTRVLLPNGPVCTMDPDAVVPLLLAGPRSGLPEMVGPRPGLAGFQPGPQRHAGPQPSLPLFAGPQPNLLHTAGLPFGSLPTQTFNPHPSSTLGAGAPDRRRDIDARRPPPSRGAEPPIKRARPDYQSRSDMPPPRSEQRSFSSSRGGFGRGRGMSRGGPPPRR